MTLLFVLTGAEVPLTSIGVAARCRARVLQGAKRLSHVMERAQSGIEFRRPGGALALLAGRAFAAPTEIKEKQQDGKDGECSDGCFHGSQGSKTQL